MVRDLKGKHPNYFEAIIQLRDVSKQVVDFVEEEIERSKIVIVKKEEVKNGLDYYLADNNQGKALGKLLQDRIGGEIKMTSSLHTKKDNKELYRVTILFREAHFRRGDEVTYQGDDYVVKSMGKDIFMQNIKNGKKVHVKYRDMREIKLI